jgi:phosphate starvation-inducible protein PhoH and related proteins
MILRHTFSPPTSSSANRRLNHLCGALDEHLRTLAVGCQVKIAHRHEQFKIDGLKRDATRALEVLQAMYELSDKPIEPETIQLMLSTDAPLHGSQPNRDAASGGNGSLSGGLSTRRADLQARSSNQAAYLANIASHDITFGIGPAGTGKTYLAVAAAVDALSRNSVQRIVLTRPAVEAGEKG